ncbi:hypothetical protein HOLleu_21850 [Holothuria leucospilota]|uniref:Uncharacterized protein n=1 Tax=Holothuria leucospilota TaxID=206669 RepID=A0A9Q1H499_HOLLE|nr:hypothetical protein HOLleu_21850 [Holothuria leucospilota]
MSKVKTSSVSPSTKYSGLRQSEANLKERVRELETEVSSLKKRLDELRKAKNTTVLKKEKEYVTSRKYQSSMVRSPRNQTDATSGDNGKVIKMQENHNAELKKLRETHSTEMEKLKEQYEKLLDSQKKFHLQTTACDHEPQLKELREKVGRLQEENATLRSTNSDLEAENVDLRSKFEELFTELSLKEAQWCEKEEQLNMKLKLQWGEKYREWMEATEKKIADLQKANDLLRSYVRPPPED